jgi:hypothetical protein
MKSKYSQHIDPVITNKTTTVTEHVQSISKCANQNGTVANKICRYTTALFIAMATVTSPVSDIRKNNTQVETTVSTTNKATYSIAQAKNAVQVENTLTSTSQKLQKEFGFKTAQWAATLQVERKTLYNWIKNPDTKVQDKVAKRLSIFSDLFEEMDTGHAHYLASFAFGRYKDAEITAALTEDVLSLETIVSNYERLYSEFDGKYKRNKHKYSSYS